MPRGRRAGSNLSSNDAQEILRQLIHDGRVSTGDINRYREIRQLEQRLQSLRGGGGSGAARRGRRPAAQPAVAGKRRRRRSSKLTPQQLASRQLQGRYLGLIRQIPAAQRARYKKMVKDKGRESAIKEMQGALKK